MMRCSVLDLIDRLAGGGDDDVADLDAGFLRRAVARPD